MDNKNCMRYRARMLVSRAMADRRAGCVLTKMADEKPQLFYQSVDTAYLAAQIAEATGYQGDVYELVLGALVHDTGMLRVPNDVFERRERLSEEEQAIVRRHVPDGAETLRKLGFGDAIVRIAEQHHERADGTGYPLGVESPSILRSTKIVIVCDVYEALTSDRPQRKAFNMYEAVAMMAGMPLSGATLQAIKRCADP